MKIGVQGIVVLAVAVCLTLVSATMTILGYTSLYSQATAIVAALFITLECAKATIFGILLNISKNQKQKSILVYLASALIVISFIGHLSYLSKAYRVNQVAISGNNEINETIKSTSAMQIRGIDEQIQVLNNEIRAGNEEIEQIRKTINDLPKATDRNWVNRSYNKRVQEIAEHNKSLSIRIQELYKERNQISREALSSVEQITANSNDIANRSVFQYTADIFHINQDTLANIINVILSLVIDTLALVMLWVAGSMWQESYNTIQKMKSKGIRETKKSLSKARNNITIDNVRNYSFDGYTVDNIIAMSDKDIDGLFDSVKSEDQLNWLNAALTLRNHANIKGKIQGNDILQYKELE